VISVATGPEGVHLGKIIARAKCVWVLAAENALLVGEELAGGLPGFMAAALQVGDADGDMTGYQCCGVVVAEDLPPAGDDLETELLCLGEAALVGSGACQSELGCQGGRMIRSEDLLPTGKNVTEQEGSFVGSCLLPDRGSQEVLRVKRGQAVFFRLVLLGAEYLSCHALSFGRPPVHDHQPR
jgi:hypothetical protein